MKTMNMISRRSFLKAAMAASAVSALALTGCGGAASSASTSTAASSKAASSAVAGETFKVGIVNYVDHASLNQIVASVESRLDELGKEKGVTFDYADYYANAQADQSNLNQIGADLVADGVDVIVAVATPTAATMLAAVEDTEIPVVYSAVTDPAAAGFDGGENMTGTSDALNTAAIMNLILAADPEIDTIGLLYDLSQDSSTQAIAVTERSAAEMPVEVEMWSMDTVKAVSWLSVLFCTIWGNCSLRTKASDMGIQIRPLPWVAMKLMFSVVANSAAQMKSPSFSRSGSSVTRMIFPCLRSSSASGMVLKFMVNSPVKSRSAAAFLL